MTRASLTSDQSCRIQRTASSSKSSSVSGAFVIFLWRTGVVRGNLLEVHDIFLDGFVAYHNSTVAAK
eukprot:3963460-Amphidinium_carterae.1